MKKSLSPRLALLFILFTTMPLVAADSEAAPTWHAQTLGQAILNMLIFAVLGIVVAVVGYKVLDKCTPGDLHKEIFENKNVAAAILAGAVILGLCIIIAAAMIG
jgi:uncharacterized membrane protein YjfL (UPF0719 family)